MHCSGGVRTERGEMLRADHSLVRARCGLAAHMVPLFDGFSLVGLQYGPLYRCLENAWGAFASAGARLRLRSTSLGAQVHPADLDGALQLGALTTSAAIGGEARLPFAVDEGRLHSAANELWAHVQSRGEGAANVSLGAVSGEIGAQLNGFKTRVLRATAASPVQRLLYTTRWQPVDQQQPAAETAALVLGSESSFSTILPNKQAPAARSTMAWSAVVATMGLQRAENGLGGLCTLELVLQLAQTQASAPRPPAVWLLTLGTQSVAGDAVSATHAGSWGLARSVRTETQMPLWCRCTGIFAFKFGVSASEPELALRVGVWSGIRLIAAASGSGSALRLGVNRRDQLRGIFTEPQPALGVPTSSEVRLHVRAVGLSFSDLLNVLGAADGSPPGSKAAGVVSSEEPSFYKADGAAFGLAHAPLASMTNTPAMLLVSKPRSVSFEGAASVPVAWSIAHIALCHSGVHSHGAQHRACCCWERGSESD